MKRIVFGCVIALTFLAVPTVGGTPARADAGSSNCTQGGQGAYTCTMHVSQVMDLGPGCGLADTVLQLEGVMHETINQNGDWFTGTFQGPAVGYDANGNVAANAHAETWFGEEDNLQNSVQHFVTNISGKLIDGTPIGGHANGDFTVNANGQVTAQHVNFFCR